MTLWEYWMDSVGSPRLQFIPCVLFHSEGGGPCLSGTGSDGCRVARYLADLQATEAH